MPQFRRREIRTFSPTRRVSGNFYRTPQKVNLRTTAFDVRCYLASAGPGKKIEQFRDKEPVFAQGDPETKVMYIQEGRVNLTVVSETGKEALVAVLETGDFLGEGCLAGQSICTSTARATMPTTLLVIDKDEMLRVLHEEHQLSDYFLGYVLERNRRAEQDLINHLFNGTEKRLARALVLLTGYGQQAEPEKTFQQVSQEVLAEMIGTTRQRVNLFMTRFRTLGFIEYGGKGRGLRVNKSLLSVVPQMKASNS